MLMRLANAVSVLEALGGPRPAKAASMSDRGYGAGSQPIGYVGDGIDALREIEGIIENHDLVRVEPEASS
jgi:hypothetical protein